MKKVSYLFSVLAICYGLLANSQAQELIASVVNTQEALALRVQLQNISRELNELKDERSLVKSEQKKLELEKTIQSLSDRYFEVKKMHAVEVLKSHESQKVLREISEALSSGHKELAGKINLTYEGNLRSQATNRLLSKEIDRSGFREEIKAIDIIVDAISTLVFTPSVVVRSSHGHE